MASLPLNRILLIEDDPDIQLIAQLALQQIGGFHVTTCSSGLEALSIASACDPDLIILDVMMPILDGPGTLIRLRAIPEIRTTPVIFMTARVQRHEAGEYRLLGAIDVIAKPFDTMALSATIMRMWTEYQHGRSA